MSTITYIYQGTDPELTYTVDYSGEEGKIVLEKNPFLIENKKVEGYKLDPTDATYAYYPLQLIDVPEPENDLTLYVTMVDAGLVQVENEGLPTKDISGMILNVVQKKGKNQPFSYVVLTVSRQLFIDADITMVQKQTKFKLNIYGITGEWIYERLEDNGSYYDITLVNRAYYLKNITLLSLFNFTFTYQDENDPPVTHTDDTKIGLTNLGFVYEDAQHDYRIELNDQDSDPNTKTYWVNNEASFTIPFDGKSLTIVVKRNIYTTTSGQQTDYSLMRISNANPDDIFYFLAKYVAEYDSQDIDIQDGYYYTGILLNDTFIIQDKYTMDEIEALKVGTTTIPSGNPTFNSASIRLDEFCWDILQSLAYLSNREIIFDDKAYFKPFTPSEDELSIDWEPPAEPQDGVTYITTMALSENDDQGSQYLTASQKVVSEAYETTVAISDTTSSYVGQDIKYLAVDDTKTETTATNNSKRNTQAKIVALNALIKNFKPGDCIEYSVNETTVPDNNGAEISDWNNFSQVANTDCFLFKVTLPGTNIVATETYYVKENGIWFEYDTDNPLREAGYDVDACVTSITDAHNNITLENVPLALKTVEYPACVTTYTWGNPEFMDEQSQFNDLAAVSQDTVLDNTSDTGISSGDATKLVVGNQYVHQLRDDRKGFTGLIMEKNLDNNVYRLVGYNQGVIQAQFNSEGKIEAGAGVAQLDENGLTVYYDSNDTAYSPQNALKFQKSDETDTDADGNPLTPYRLYAKYDSATSSTTSVVQAQKQTIYHVYPRYTEFTTKYQYAGYYVDYNDTKVLVSSWSQSPYYFNTVVTTPGETIAYTASEYPAILEMVCDQGGATTSMELLDNDTAAYIPVSGYIDINFPTGSTPHVIYISPTSDNTITGSISLNLVMSDDSIYDHIDTPKPGQTVAIGYYPQYVKSIRFRNNTGSQVYLEMSKWVIRYSNSSGTGASLTMGDSGSELKGDLKANGNMVQLGGSVVFYGPDGHTTGAISALTPTQFYTPILSNSAVTAPLIQGLNSITVGTTIPVTGILKVGKNNSNESITALGKIDTGYSTLNDFACRRIHISSSAPGGAHDGDIWLDTSGQS